MHGPYQGEGKQAICLNQVELASDKHKKEFGITRKSVYVEVIKARASIKICVRLCKLKWPFFISLIKFRQAIVT